MDRIQRPPRRIDGWRGLSDWLVTLGIIVSANALYARTRRHYLPFQGGRTPGGRVHFRRPDLDAWVKHFVGVTHETWCRQRARERRRGLRIVRASSGRYLQRYVLEAHRRPPATAWPQYALLRPNGDRLELVREADGAVAAVRDRSELVERWLHRRIQPGCLVAAYGSARPTVAEDFEAPREHSKAASLLGALRVESGQLRWIQIDGRRLGLPCARRTRVVLHSSFPELYAVRQRILRAAPDAIWLAWPGQILLDPLGLDEVEAG